MISIEIVSGWFYHTYWEALIDFHKGIKLILKCFSEMQRNVAIDRARDIQWTMIANQWIFTKCYTYTKELKLGQNMSSYKRHQSYLLCHIIHISQNRRSCTRITIIVEKRKELLLVIQSENSWLTYYSKCVSSLTRIARYQIHTNKIHVHVFKILDTIHHIVLS